VRIDVENGVADLLRVCEPYIRYVDSIVRTFTFIVLLKLAFWAL
jgi:hypothetical protein